MSAVLERGFDHEPVLVFAEPVAGDVCGDGGEELGGCGGLGGLLLLLLLLGGVLLVLLLLRFGLLGLSELLLLGGVSQVRLHLHSR